jgi:polysaccharide pyruvyl transferase WcaK-like protein
LIAIEHGIFVKKDIANTVAIQEVHLLRRNMIVSIKSIIKAINEAIDKRYYSYDIGANFDKRTIIITLGRKKSPFYQVFEELPFDSDKYTDEEFIQWRVEELMQELREKGR